MRKEEFILAFEKQLVRLGCPVKQAHATAREISEHYDDLKADATEEGMLEDEAASRTEERLGEPRALAERFATALRKSSWWGRHPIIGLCLLPSLGMFILLTLMPCVALLVTKGALSANRWREISDGGAGYGVFAVALQSTFYGSLISLMIWMCRTALRSFVGLRWLALSCVLCSIHAVFINVYVFPHNLYVGYLNHPNWVCAAIPLLCAAIVLSRQWIALTRVMAVGAAVMFVLSPTVRAAEKNVQPDGWIGGEFREERPWSVRQLFFPPPEVVYDRSFPKALESQPGAVIKVSKLGTNTPAADAGLRKGDLILEMNESPVSSLKDFEKRIDQCKPGTTVALTVYRDGTNLNIPVIAGLQRTSHDGIFSLSMVPAPHAWQLIPDRGLSFVFVGVTTEGGVRQQLKSRKQIYNPSWRAWVGPFEFSAGRTVYSETNYVAPPIRPPPPVAENQTSD